MGCGPKIFCLEDVKALEKRMALKFSEKTLKAEREKTHKYIETMEAFEEDRKHLHWLCSLWILIRYSSF